MAVPQAKIQNSTQLANGVERIQVRFTFANRREFVSVRVYLQVKEGMLIADRNDQAIRQAQSLIQGMDWSHGNA